jgi:hypothetical protein
MSHPSAEKYFLYGLLIAGLKEFITRGVLEQSYFVWVLLVVRIGVLR